MRIKWERAKTKAISLVEAALSGSPPAPMSGDMEEWLEAQAGMIKECLARGKPLSAKERKEVRDRAVQIINRWDVRCAPALIERFPECVPRALRGKPLAVHMDDDLNWWLMPQEEIDCLHELGVFFNALK